MNDYLWMFGECYKWIHKTAYAEIELYISGFTPITLAFIKAWETWYNALRDSHTQLCSLKIMHFNPTTGNYDEQIWRDAFVNEVPKRLNSSKVRVNQQGE